MKEIAASADEAYTLIHLSDDTVTFNYRGAERMQQVMRTCGCAIAYSDYITSDGDNLTPHPLIPYQKGSVRDDFDFGKVVMVPTALLREAVAEMTDDYQAAGWYDLRLRLSRKGAVLHIPEPLYTVSPTVKRDSEEERPTSPTSTHATAPHRSRWKWPQLPISGHWELWCSLPTANRST